MTKDEFCLTLVLRYGNFPLTPAGMVPGKVIDRWRRARVELATELGFGHLIAISNVLHRPNEKHHTVPSLRYFELWLKEHGHDQG